MFYQSKDHSKQITQYKNEIQLISPAIKTNANTILTPLPLVFPKMYLLERG